MKSLLTFLLLSCIILCSSYSSFSQKTGWSQLADFPGGTRTGAFGFTIGNKLYLGGGANTTSVKKDFWEYNLSTGVWTRKADFAGGTRNAAFSFNIGSKGYVGTGARDKSADTLTKDFWEYNPATDKWTRKADFGGGVRQSAFGTATSTKGYAGTGLSSKDITALKNDSWEYDPATDKWKRRDKIGFFGRFGATAFTINGKVYAGTGIDIFASPTKDFYEFNPSSNKWKHKAKFGGAGVAKAVGFTIGSTGYLGTGFDGKDYRNEFWAYNPAKDVWTKTTTFPGAARIGAVGFSYNGAGFLATGSGGGFFADVWKFVPPAVSAAITNYSEMITAAPAPGVKIFPNPAAAQFTLSMDGGTQTAQTTVSIYTMQGRLAARYDLGTIPGNFSKTINIAAVAPGLYKVEIVRGAKRETASLVVAR